MNVLIVHADPEPKSLSAAMCLRGTQQLRLMGHQVRVSDLHALDFNPVASAADFGERCAAQPLAYALEQRHAQERGTLAADIRAEVAKLLWCDLLILNFRLFWFSTPAILKGWIDRVLLSGLVYGPRRFYDRGGLVGKRSMLSITVAGQEHLFGPQGVHGPLEDMLRHLLRGTLAYTGMAVLPPFVAWRVPRATATDHERVLHDYCEALRTLDERTPLSFPSLSDYDERLMPLSRS